ncbi:unnamed protein product [Protopolystoma xenopodis]|uniref:Uncharacterized protein n=1 Tax=Protopolystoma xenopodis TaxID=117903 RepID=A0A3S5CSU4_9PLAT|nr:unnamed protein product [Protopolystoma xenopodis]
MHALLQVPHPMWSVAITAVSKRLACRLVCTELLFPPSPLRQDEEGDACQPRRQVFGVLSPGRPSLGL